MTAEMVFLLVVLFSLLLSSTPVAVALGLTSFAFYWYFTTIPLVDLPETLFSALDTFPLMAVPFFILAANVMTAGGISKRLVAAGNALVGGVRGGLAVTAVVACMFFAAISGSSPATVVAVGTVLVPAMIAKGYGKKFSMGLIATSGSLGILIPPSIPLIVYGIATEESIGDLFIAGILPGLVAGLMLLLAVVVLTRIKKLDDHGERLSLGAKLRAVGSATLALFLPGLVLGGIYGGVFTPTEAAAMAVLYAVIISMFVYREITIADLGRTFLTAARTSAMVMFIIANGILFTKVLTNARIPRDVAARLLDTNLNAITFLLLVNLVLLVAGAFMETSSAILVLAPILLPVAVELGIHPVHLGIIMIMNLEIGMVTPPLGLNLFVASGMSRMSVLQVARAAAPSGAVLLVALLIVTYVPYLSLALLN